MGDVSLLEGVAKKFLNMVPRQFYREAAQKLVHEICETIYNDLDEKERFPRVEIIKIVEDFVNTHLGNPPENPNENPMGIRDAISDVLKKTTLDVYKDDVVNKLLLQKILLEEFENKVVTKKGIFYKSLDQSIINTAKKPHSKNRLGKKNEQADTANKEGAQANAPSKMLPKIDKQKVFAKNVLAALPNVDIDNTPAPSAGADSASGAADSGADDSASPAADSGASASASGAAASVAVVVPGDPAPAITSGDKQIESGKNQVGGLPFNPMAIAGTAMLAATMAKEAGIIGNKSGSGSGSGNGGTTNIGYEPNKNGVLPYIQTNCNGSGLGLPGIDLNFLSKFLDGLKEPIAEELIKKIQERLPESTIDSITVKRNIYDKILLVIQAHLQSQQGKDMLLGHIKTIVEPEIKFLTQDNEVKKRLIKVIFKNKSSEIYKKLIDIIANNTTESKPPEKTKDDCKCDDKSAKKTDTQFNQGEAVAKKGGADTEQTGAKNENNANFTTDITKVIEELNEFINVDINTFDGFPEVKKSIKETAIAQFKIALVEQQKNMEKDAKNNEENAKKANEEGIKKIALGSVQSKIDEIKQKEKEIQDKMVYIKSTDPITVTVNNSKDEGSEVRPTISTENGGNNKQPNEEDNNKQLSDVDKVYENFNKKSIGNEEDELKNELELKQKDTSKKTKEKLINRTIGNRAIEKVNEQIQKEKPHTSSSSSSSVSNSALLNPIKNNDTLQKQEFDELKRKNLIKKKGGNPTKNKTKRRRTKNNTRKMKQKRRTIKKT
jgi:hypothetical protein